MIFADQPASLEIKFLDDRANEIDTWPREGARKYISLALAIAERYETILHRDATDDPLRVYGELDRILRYIASTASDLEDHRFAFTTYNRARKFVEESIPFHRTHNLRYDYELDSATDNAKKERRLAAQQKILARSGFMKRMFLRHVKRWKV